MSTKINRTVVRNKGYASTSFTTCYRHNERRNEDYFNVDIDPSREHLNVSFHYHPKVEEPSGIVIAEAYEETFNRMLDEGTVVKRGLRTGAKVFNELVFDVNTAYFENNGGYEYAKSFFEEAHKMAVNEIGGEQYIISSIMHADERNKALSEQLGYDVYHYHLHVVYVPVVEKEIYFKKNNKNPELAGKLKEVIPQISHSKKWPRRVPVDKNGKTVMLNSYSLLQDRFFEHMKAAGFEGFERGERGSTTEHLEVLDYKIQQDTIRAEEAAAIADAKEKEVAALNKKVAQSQKQLDGLNEKTAVSEKVVAELEEIEKLGHKRTVFGAVTIPDKGWQKILNLVKETFKSRREIGELKSEIRRLKAEVKAVTEVYQEQKTAYSRLVEQVQPYLNAVKLFPQQVKDTITHFIDLGRRQQQEQQKPPEVATQITKPKTKTKSRTEAR